MFISIRASTSYFLIPVAETSSGDIPHSFRGNDKEISNDKRSKTQSTPYKTYLHGYVQTYPEMWKPGSVLSYACYVQELAAFHRLAKQQAGSEIAKRHLIPQPTVWRKKNVLK